MSRKSKILSNAELSAFCQQISLIIAAGLPTYYGVSILCDEAPDKQISVDVFTEFHEYGSGAGKLTSKLCIYL